jgi:hypothetical protein
VVAAAVQSRAQSPYTTYLDKNSFHTIQVKICGDTLYYYNHELHFPRTRKDTCTFRIKGNKSKLKTQTVASNRNWRRPKMKLSGDRQILFLRLSGEMILDIPLSPVALK